MSKLKRLRERVSYIKIQSKLLFLIILVGIFCLVLFRFLWHKKWTVYYFLDEHIPVDMQPFPMPDPKFWINLGKEAKKYEIPESEDDKERVKAMEPFFSLADDYTSIAIYGIEDGLYRTGYFPEVLYLETPFHYFFQFAYSWIDEDVDQHIERVVEFKNGYADVMISFYHSSFFILPYATFCLFLCVFLFLFIILFFVGKKMKIIVRLEQAALQMSSGDLETPIGHAGYDEIGILAAELDNLRLTLHENFIKESEAHRSNQELITALSHDLRTPLTILKGYLEILKLNRNPALQEEYISRCIAKADDLKEMTDRMFEYALVFDEEADAQSDQKPAELPFSFFADSLREHADFLRLAGFSSELKLPEPQADKTAFIFANEAMAKRVMNNVFSNVIKYADKKETVLISTSFQEALTVFVQNGIREKDGVSDIESTQIGLKSAKRMMERMDGALTVIKEGDTFLVKLQFSNA